MWDYTRIGIHFFQDMIPFSEMEPADELVSEGNYCLAKPGEIYLIYLPYGGHANIDLSGIEGNFSVGWFNPRSGGDLINTAAIAGGGQVDLGAAAEEREKDWAILIQKQ
jgi:hypothetical protein